MGRRRRSSSRLACREHSEVNIKASSSSSSSAAKSIFVRALRLIIGVKLLCSHHKYIHSLDIQSVSQYASVYYILSKSSEAQQQELYKGLCASYIVWLSSDGWIWNEMKGIEVALASTRHSIYFNLNRHIIALY